MKIIDSKGRFSRYLKPIIHKIIFRKKIGQRVLIFGCQRSGTTLLSKLFDDHLRCSVYSEASILSNDDQFKLRLNCIEDVISKLNRDVAPIVIMKPLVESQNSRLLLDEIPNSKAIWLFREPSEVVHSAIVKFGPYEGAINKIKPLFDKEFAKNPWTPWLTENISEKLLAEIKPFYAENISANDAGLIFWYLRNMQFFENNLQNDKRAILLSYESLLEGSDKISNFIDDKKFQLSFSRVSRQSSRKKLDCNIELMNKCKELYNKMEVLACK